MKNKQQAIGSFEAKTHLSRLLNDVQAGKEYIITRRGKPVARLIPFENPETAADMKDILQELDSVRNSAKGSVNIKKFINEGRKR